MPVRVLEEKPSCSEISAPPFLCRVIQESGWHSACILSYQAGKSEGVRSLQRFLREPFRGGTGLWNSA